MPLIPFKPFIGLSSKHLQTILPSFCSPGKESPSQILKIPLEGKNILSCHLSTPLNWLPYGKTIILVHGLGGSHLSNYMVRIARKLYLKDCRVLRINLRGCGSGKGLSHLPYHAGVSDDILKVIQFLKEANPDSSLHLVGFSLGGNIALKLMGELGEKAIFLLKNCIAICPPLDLRETVLFICQKKHMLYHNYYLKKVVQQASIWVSKNISSLYQFDDEVTAPLWGYENADAYYQACSCLSFLAKIKQQTHLLASEDDPFVSLKNLQTVALPHSLNIWKTRHGGHMGFLGSVFSSKFYWMDQWLEELLTEDYNFQNKN